MNILNENELDSTSKFYFKMIMSIFDLSEYGQRKLMDFFLTKKDISFWINFTDEYKDRYDSKTSFKPFRTIEELAVVPIITDPRSFIDSLSEFGISIDDFLNKNGKCLSDKISFGEFDDLVELMRKTLCKLTYKSTFYDELYIMYYKFNDIKSKEPETISDWIEFYNAIWKFREEYYNFNKPTSHFEVLSRRSFKFKTPSPKMMIDGLSEFGISINDVLNKNGKCLSDKMSYDEFNDFAGLIWKMLVNLEFTESEDEYFKNEPIVCL